MYSNLIALVLHVGIIYLFVYTLQMGVIGVALSLSINFTLRFVLIYIFTKNSKFGAQLVSLKDEDNFVNLKP